LIAFFASSTSTDCFDEGWNLGHVPAFLQDMTLPAKFLRPYNSAVLYTQYCFEDAPDPLAALPPVAVAVEPEELLEPLDPLFVPPLLELEPVAEAELLALDFFFFADLALSLVAPPSSDLECLLLPKVKDGKICILKLAIVELAKSATVSTHSWKIALSLPAETKSPYHTSPAGAASYLTEYENLARQLWT
jgi:hypothetical protein